MILVLANDAWSEAIFLVVHKYLCFLNWIFLWWLYRAFQCKSEEIYPPNLLSTALGRRVWWCGVSILLLILFMQESWFLPWFGSWYAISKVYLDPLLASMGSWLRCWWCSCLSLIKCSWYLLCSSPGGLPCTSLVHGTPPCLPCTSLVLGLLLAATWSCLSDHDY
jgi:hypothetical protein